MSVKRYNLFLLSLLLALTIPVNLFGQSKLQQYLDGLAGSQSASTRASSTPTVIDLSEFDSDVTETLYVRNTPVRVYNPIHLHKLPLLELGIPLSSKQSICFRK